MTYQPLARPKHLRQCPSAYVIFCSITQPQSYSYHTDTSLSGRILARHISLFLYSVCLSCLYVLAILVTCSTGALDRFCPFSFRQCPCTKSMYLLPVLYDIPTSANDLRNKCKTTSYVSLHLFHFEVFIYSITVQDHVLNCGIDQRQAQSRDDVKTVILIATLPGIN
jgi:hypothetical protein